MPAVKVPNPQPALRTTGAVEARVRVRERVLELAPDQSGNFPLVPVEPQAGIPIQVRVEGGRAGDVVVLQAEDGGELPNGTILQTVKLDDSLVASSLFRVTAQDGIHRVSVQHNGDLKVLAGWVGKMSATRADSPRQAL